MKMITDRQGFVILTLMLLPLLIGVLIGWSVSQDRKCERDHNCVEQKP